MDDFPLLFHLLFLETNLAIKAPNLTNSPKRCIKKCPFSGTMEATMTPPSGWGNPLLVAVEGEAAVVRKLHFQGQAFLLDDEAWMKGPQMLGTGPFHKDYMTLPNVIGQIFMSLDCICLFLDQLG